MSFLRPDIDAAVAYQPEPRTVSSISARDAEKWVTRAARNRPLTITVRAAEPPSHPWFTRLIWDADLRDWRYSVQPGAVNGLDPRYPSGVGLEIDPVTRATHAEPSHAPWRAVGTDAVGSLEAVPEFFAARGVAPAPEVEGTLLDGLVTELASGSARLLRAAELVLVQPKPALSVQLAHDGRALEFLVTTPADTRPSLGLRRDWQPEVNDGIPAGTQFATGFTDIARSELHLATIYLLAPEGAPWGGAPDGEWEPFVHHRVFRNLNFAVDRDLTAPPPSALFYPGIGLALGAGDAAIKALVDQAAQAEAQAAAILNGSRIRGHFWTL